MNLDHLRERDDKSRCSTPLCRGASQVIYHPGATPANPRKTLTFCDPCHDDFCEQPESKWRREVSS